METYRVRAWGLWPTGLACHDDLVDRQDCASGFGGELDGPLLGDEKIEDAFILGVKSASVVIVLGVACQFLIPGCDEQYQLTSISTPVSQSSLLA